VTDTRRRIAIIGTGFSGLCIGHFLKKRDDADITIFEKAGRIGGTWRDNIYPGAECDVPSALYSFSFVRNPNWTHKWSEQPEILAYMDQCCEKFGLMPHIRFNTEVTEARFDEAAGVWRVTAGGETSEFDVVISAVGQLHKPSFPAIEGADSFEGTHFHSAEWDHRIDLAGKRVAVIGNAASALQFIPQIAPNVAHMDVYQRSPNWVLPKNDRAYNAFEKWAGTALSPLTQLYRFFLWFRAEVLLFPLMEGIEENGIRKKVKEQAIQYIHDNISDPVLREKLVPNYPVGAKRILFSDDYYEGLNRDNVKVVTDPIVRIVKNGVVTGDGTVREADVLVYATGFVSTDFLTPMEVIGRGGQSLNDKWAANGAEAYYGITHTGFPNFFMMYGPNTNLGHNSIIVMIEAQTRFILSCLDQLDARMAKWLDVTAQAQTAYNDHLAERMEKMAWNAVEESWYKRDGKIINNWVGRTWEYRNRTKRMTPDAFEYGS